MSRVLTTSFVSRYFQSYHDDGGGSGAATGADDDET